MIRLRSLGALDDVKFNLIPFFQTLIAVALDGTIVYEDICPAVATEKAKAFRVVEPLYRTLILCQFIHSLPWPIGWLAIRLSRPAM